MRPSPPAFQASNLCVGTSELLERVLSQPQSAQDDKVAHTRAIVLVSWQQTAVYTQTHTLHSHLDQLRKKALVLLTRVQEETRPQLAGLTSSLSYRKRRLS